MKLQPLGETIIVLPDKIVGETASGIVLSDFSKKRPTSGTIIAIGSKAEEGKYGGEFKVGQRVLYGEFSGAREIMFYGGKDEELFLMQPEDILALLE